MTPVDELRNILFGWMYALSPATVQLIIQLDCLVLIPIALTGIGYLVCREAAAVAQQQPEPSIVVQGVLCVSGWVIAILLPMSGLFIWEPSTRLWLVVMSAFCIVGGIYLLGFLLGLAPEPRKFAVQAMYTAVLILWLWHTFRGGWRQ